SLMAARGDVQPRTMTMMGGPIDARRSPTAVNNLARRKPYAWFEQNVIQRVPAKYPGYMRRVYPGFLQHLGFVAMNPDRHLNAHVDYYHKLIAGDGESAAAHRRFSPSRASWTTSRATARPRPRTSSASTFRASGACTTSRRAWVTTGFSR